MLTNMFLRLQYGRAGLVVPHLDTSETAKTIERGLCTSTETRASRVKPADWAAGVRSRLPKTSSFLQLKSEQLHIVAHTIDMHL